MQYRAANKIFNRVTDNIEGRDDKNSGLIWHWQGSGKTLTMIFAAYKLYKHKLLENPSLFFIVDRLDNRRDREVLESELPNDLRNGLASLPAPIIGPEDEVASRLDASNELAKLEAVADADEKLLLAALKAAWQEDSTISVREVARCHGWDPRDAEAVLKRLRRKARKADLGRPSSDEN